MRWQDILNALTSAYRDALGSAFIGMYVHGSAAMGCWNPRVSDIDYLCVVDTEPDAAAKRAVLDATVALLPGAPAKGLEMHILRLEDCLVPRHPVSFCLHFSPAHLHRYIQDSWGYIETMRGEDSDLAAHLAVVRSRGVCWDGPPIGQVFGEIPWEAYMDSVLADLEWDPGSDMYRIANLCRTYAFLKTDRILSKLEGMEQYLEEHPDCIPVKKALAAYRMDGKLSGSTEIQQFCESLHHKILAIWKEQEAP